MKHSSIAVHADLSNFKMMYCMKIVVEPFNILIKRQPREITSGFENGCHHLLISFDVTNIETNTK